MDSELITVENICEALGRRTIADAIGVRLTSVSNAIVDGRFPARWFHLVDHLCAERGLPCPRRLFTFVGADEASASRQLSPTPNQETSHDLSQSDASSDAA